MFPFAMGALSAGSLGIADFIASQSSEKLGAARALGGMLLVSSIALTVAMIANEGFAPLLQHESLVGNALAAAHGSVMAIALLLFFYAMSVGKISVVAPIIAAHPAFVVVFYAIKGTPFAFIQIVAIAGILIGVGLVAGFGQDQNTSTASNKIYSSARRVVLVSAAASLIYGIAIILLQEASLRIDDLQVLWFGRVTGLLTVAAILIIRGSAISGVSMKWLSVFVVHGLLDSGGLLFILLGTNGGASNAITVVVASTFPVVTVGLAALILKERISSWQIIGAASVFVFAAILVGAAAS